MTTNESLFVIQQYVKIRKGVDIVPRANVIGLQLMGQMTTHALCWLKQSKVYA